MPAGDPTERGMTEHTTRPPVRHPKIVTHTRLTPPTVLLRTKSLALVLAENGSSPRLEELLSYGTANVIPAQHDNAVRFAEWVRNRAARSA